MTALQFSQKISHNGGPCPVPESWAVRVWWRSGGFSDATTARCFDWVHNGTMTDIIAYAVATPPQPAAPAVEAWSPYNNRVRTDLLTPEELATLKASGPWEFRGEDPADIWLETGAASWIGTYVYRAVRQPETRTVVMHLGQYLSGWAAGTAFAGQDTHTFTLTLDAAGKPLSVGDLREKGAGG